MAKSSKKKTNPSLNPPPAPPLVLKWWNNNKVIAIGLFTLSILLYSNTLFNGFVKDDTLVIVKNNFTKKGVEGLVEIFSNETYTGVYGEEIKNIEIYTGRYRPLSLAFFALIYEAFQATPIAYHLLSIILYGLCVVMTYFSLRYIFEKRFDKRNAAILSLVSAVIFLAHPIHTEAVNNIKNCDWLLGTVFSLCALYMALRFYDTRKYWMALLSGFIFFLALLSNENMLVFLAIIPFVLLFIQNSKKKEFTTILATIAPLIIFSGIYLLIKTNIVGPSPTDSLNLTNNPFIKVQGSNWVFMNGMEKAAMIFYALGKYIQLIIFPHPLTTDYNPRFFPLTTFANPIVILSIITYFGAILYLLIKIIRGKINLISLGLFVFIIPVLFTSNIFFLTGTSLSELFLFIPSLGFCIFIAGLIYPLLPEGKTTVLKKIIAPAAAFILLIFSVKTFTRNLDFESNRKLLYKDIKVSSGSAVIQNAVGALKAEEALHTLSLKEKDSISTEALVHLSKSIEINPTFVEAYYMRGNVFYMMKNYEAAVNDYKTCLNLNPNYSLVYANLALALKGTAKTWINNNNNLQKAIDLLQESYDIFPNDPETITLIEQAQALISQTGK